MKNNATCTIRSEKITIDVRICAALAANRGGEVYLAAIAPDMELTVITLDEAPDILPCFDEDDACLNLPNTSLLLCYNPAQVLKMGGKHYLTGPVILVRTNMDGEVISLTIDEVYLFQKYLASHSITLMADDQKLPCICMQLNRNDPHLILPGTSTSRMMIWVSEAPNRNSPGTSKPSVPCSSWKRSTGVPPPRSSRCFRSMWAGAVWQTLLTPAKIIGQRNTPN